MDQKARNTSTHDKVRRTTQLTRIPVPHNAPAHHVGMDSVDEHPIREKTFVVGHTFEDDLAPNAYCEFNSFFFEHLAKKMEISTAIEGLTA